jgi:hypothetical protein
MHVDGGREQKFIKVVIDSCFTLELDGGMEGAQIFPQTVLIFSSQHMNEQLKGASLDPIATQNNCMNMTLSKTKMLQHKTSMTNWSRKLVGTDWLSLLSKASLNASLPSPQGTLVYIRV